MPNRQVEQIVCYIIHIQVCYLKYVSYITINKNIYSIKKCYQIHCDFQVLHIFLSQKCKKQQKQLSWILISTHILILHLNILTLTEVYEASSITLLFYTDKAIKRTAQEINKVRRISIQAQHCPTGCNIAQPTTQSFLLSVASLSCEQ